MRCAFLAALVLAAFGGAQVGESLFETTSNGLLAENRIEPMQRRLLL